MSDLFNQATNQLNFLLLSQRTMVLISAFSVAFAGFNLDDAYPLKKYLVVSLFVLSIAYGLVAAEDFKKYIKDAKKVVSSDDELELLETFEKWTYFSYTLVGIIIFIMLTYSKVNFFNRIQISLGLLSKKHVRRSRRNLN